MSVLSLYDLSVQNTARLLKQQVWSVSDNCNIGSNSFSYLPTSVVEDLFSCVLKISQILRVSDVYPLVTSGRIKHFKLEKVCLTPEVLNSILETLSEVSQSLNSFILRSVTFVTTKMVRGTHVIEDFLSRHALSTSERRVVTKCIVNSAPNLEIIESCISLDFEVIRRCTNLKILRLNFIPSTSMSDILDKEDGVFCTNMSLKVFDVDDDVRHLISSTDVAVLLSNCCELLEMNCDISVALEHLHSDEISKGTISRQYKLKKFILGVKVYRKSCASLQSARIATLTCPLVEELDTVVNDNHTILAMSDFLNLKSLLIRWDSFPVGDFRLGVQLLLEKIGENLIDLRLLNFCQVDFALIGSTCPNLETLEVEYRSDCPSKNDSSCNIFSSLQSLSIECTGDIYGLEEGNLLLLLSNCKNLTSLFIEFADCLNDRVLREVLSKNAMSKVKDATIYDCSLTEEGVRNLATHMKMLKFFSFTSSAVRVEEVPYIVFCINPDVDVDQFNLSYNSDY